LAAFLGLSESTPRCLALQALLEPLGGYYLLSHLLDLVLTVCVVLPDPPQTAVLPRAETLISRGLITSTRAALDNRPNVVATIEPVPTRFPGPSSVKPAVDDGATPAARKSRPAKVEVEGPTKRDTGGVEHLVACPVIIKLQDDSYIEIRCDRCLGNSSWVHDHFINGVRGLQSHLRQVHQDTLTLGSLLQRCKFRDVSAEEVEKINSGELKIDSIPCQSTGNIGMGTEYVGGPPAKKPAKVASGTPAAESLAADDAAGIKNEDSPSKKKTVQPQTTFLDNCHVVVQPSGQVGDAGFIELCCDICHGNGSFGSGKLLSGVRGFKMHFHQIHKESISTADVLQRCRHRDVPPEEVQEIRAGKVSVGFVRCAGSSKVRPKASYRDFNNSRRT
jgi:hypothetical protein